LKTAAPFLIKAGIALLFLLSLHSGTRAQLVVRQEKNFDKMVKQVLVGSGVTINNVVYLGDTGAIAIFDGRASNLGLDSGILISTGKAVDAIGPNNLTNSGSSNNQGPDADLNKLSNGKPTFDAASLSFDFTPVSDKIKFRFVFGSEEYPEFVGQGYNDVFGFFIEGPGFAGKQNIALVPGTTTPISIESINANVNSQYYTDNTGGATIQYDAFTKVLEITANVEACKTYHIKLAIADVLDFSFDSGIFMEALSFKSEKDDDVYVKRTIKRFTPNINEDCDTATFSFIRNSTNVSNDLLVNYTLGGTATYNTDYTSSIPLTGNITIPAGQTSASVNIIPVLDALTEGSESVTITINNPSLCIVSMDSVLIKDIDTLAIDTILKVNCSGDTTYWTVKVLGGTGDYEYEWTDSLGNPKGNGPILIVNPDSLTLYIIKVTDKCTGEIEYDSIRVPPIIPVTITTIRDTVVCAGATIQLSATSDFPGATFEWSAPTGIFNNTNVSNPLYTVSNSALVTYVTVTVTNDGTCAKPKVIGIHVIPKGVIGNTKYRCKSDGPVELVAFGGKTYLWSPATNINDVTSERPMVSPAVTTTYTVQITDSINCTVTRTVKVVVDTLPVAYAGEDDVVCSRSQVQLNATGSDYDTYEWFPKSSLSDPYISNPRATPTVTTDYIVKVMNNACFTYDTVTIFVIDSAKAAFNVVIDSCARTIAIQNMTTGTTNVAWDFGDGKTSTDFNPIHVYDSLGNFTLTMEANPGTSCNDIAVQTVNFATIDINQRVVPNVFTPNNDGYNDLFKITGGNVECRLEKMTIFNRWGKKLYETKDKDNLSWDGTVNGQIVPPGVYFYVIEGKGFKDTGTVTVVL
jgi:gliding motility-associated-like protein